MSGPQPMALPGGDFHPIDAQVAQIATGCDEPVLVEGQAAAELGEFQHRLVGAIANQRIGHAHGLVIDRPRSRDAIA